MNRVASFILILLSSQIFAQSLDIYKYVNVNDLVYRKNCELLYNEIDCMYEYKVKKVKLDYSDAMNFPGYSDKTKALEDERNSQISRIREEYTDGWEISGVLDVYVLNKVEENALRKKIDKEIVKLEKIKRQKIEEAKLSCQPYEPLYMKEAGCPQAKCVSIEYRLLISRFRNLKYRIKIGNPTEQKVDAKKDYLEAEFLAEIAQINKAIGYINTEARQKNIMAALTLTHALTHRLRIKMSGNWFYESLKKIRKNNPEFTFTINPLAEEMTREYWILMRNRANIAYRNAMEAHSGCIINEGIQTALKVEISMRALKTIYDLVNGLSGVLPKNFFGVLQNIRNHVTNEGTIGRLVQQEGTMWIQKISKTQLIAEEIYKGARGANEDAFDYKSYIGLVGSLMSAADGFKKVEKGIKEHQQQSGLLKANRQSAKNLMSSGRKMMLEYDKYRANLDSKLWVIDRLHDQIERIKMDKHVAKDHWNKQSVWGKTEFMWDVEYYANMIDESGKDLENGYIYYEDFIKTLQIVIEHSRQDYRRIEEKVKQSGAPQNEIQAQLSYNSDNEAWFDNKIEELVMKYSAYGDKIENKLPENMIHVSHQVVPGVEDQNVAPKTKEVWEVDYEDEVVNQMQTSGQTKANNFNTSSTQNHNSFSGVFENSGNTSSIATTVSSGNGWQADKVENSKFAIKTAVEEAVQSSKTPIGIYINDGSDVKIYYIEGNDLGITASTLKTYHDASSLQNGITAQIEEGYFPIGLSFSNSSNLNVLFVKAEIHATAWQLVESQLDLNLVSTNMQPWIDKQYVPVGITVFNGMYYTLMTQIPNTKITSWKIEGYQDNNNEIIKNVNNNINSGLLPFGFLKEGNIVNVLYVGF